MHDKINPQRYVKPSIWSVRLMQMIKMTTVLVHYNLMQLISREGRDIPREWKGLKVTGERLRERQVDRNDSMYISKIFYYIVSLVDLYITFWKNM